MTKEALIQLGLTEEQAEKVIAMAADSFEGYVPKEKLEAMETENAQLTASLQERDKQLEGLKGAVGVSEELKKQLEEAIAANKADAQKHEADLAAYKKDVAVNMQLMQNGAKNIKAVKALLDMTKVSVDGENIIGLKEQLEAVKASDSYLFDPTVSGREPYSGSKTTPDEKDNPFKKETFNLTRQGQIVRDNPELAKKLRMAAGYKE